MNSMFYSIFWSFTKYTMVRKLTNTVIAASKYATGPSSVTAWTAAMVMISLLKNPPRGGIPDIAREPMEQVAVVTGIFFHRPPSSRRSRVPVEYSTAPEQRNKSDLKKA